MASIRKYLTWRGERRFEVRWRESGRDCSKAFRREADARRFRVDVESRLQLGTLYDAKPERFGEFLNAWLTRYERRVRPSTFARTRAALIHWQTFGSTPLPELRVAQVEDRLVEVATTAPRQAQMALRLLKQVLVGSA